jgi:hypothetical protein
MEFVHVALYEIQAVTLLDSPVKCRLDCFGRIVEADEGSASDVR